MSSVVTQPPNTISREARVFFVLIIAAIAPLGLVLYFLPNTSNDFWAWEVAQPRSAMLIGGIYVAAVLYYLLLLRQRDWIAVQSSMAGLVLFSLWLLAGAALHWPLFHSYRLLTLIWLAAYYVPPLFVPILSRLQAERFPQNLGRGQRIAVGWRVWLWLRGGVYLSVAVACFIFAEALATAWPWPIEPVNICMFSGQIVAFGAYQAVAMREGTWRRIRLAMLFTVFLALIQLMGLGLNGTAYDGRALIGILLPAMFVEWLVTAVMLLAIYGWKISEEGQEPQ